MRTSLTSLFIAAGSLAASAGLAADIESIAECTERQQAEQYDGVDNYAIVMEIMGQSVPQYFERGELTGPDGETYSGFVLVPPDEIARRQDTSGVTPEALEAYGDGMRMTGDALEAEAAKSGLPVDMIYSQGPPPGEEPWASPNPSVMMGSMADFVDFAADAKRRKAEGVPAQSDMEKVFANAEVVGTETVNGRSAWHVLSEDVNLTQTSDGQEFTIHDVNVWVDQEDCVPLMFRMEGEAKMQGEARDIFLEKVDSDWRTVEGTKLSLPFVQTMRMGGVLTPEEQAQMEEARKQMAEFEKQMAAMPASQRAMMERMMGGQMKQLQSLVETGMFEMEFRVLDVRVNEGIEGLAALSMPAGMPAAAAAPGMNDGGLVAMIQRDLGTLGYFDGDASGELDKMTVVAISRFQAENGMEVTGEATPQLAGILSARVDALD